MEIVNDIQTIDNLECLLPIAEDIIQNYCIDNEIEDKKSIPPPMWKDILDEICRKLFKANKMLLKLEGSYHNEYDKDKVLYLYDEVYTKLSNRYCQEISQKGFILFSGIDKQTIYNWKKGSVISSPFDLHQKIMEDNEESLFDLSSIKGRNPLSYMAKLNAKHGWREEGRKENITEVQTTRIEDLKGRVPKLCENDTQFEWD